MVLVGGVPVVAATNAENGVVYVLNEPLIKDEVKNIKRNIFEEIKNRPELSIFNDYLERTDFAQKLQGIR